MATTDLYQNTTIPMNTPTTNSSSVLNDISSALDFHNINVNQNWLDLGKVISVLNYFILAWLLVYTVLMLIDFYFKYFIIAAQDAQIQTQEVARKKLEDILFSWITFIPCVLMFKAFVSVDLGGFRDLFGLFTIAAYVTKLMAIDVTKTVLVKIMRNEDTTIIGKMISVPVNILKGIAGGDSKKH